MSLTLTFDKRNPAIEVYYRPWNAHFQFVTFTDAGHGGNVDIDLPIAHFILVMRRAFLAAIRNPDSVFAPLIDLLITSNVVQGWNDGPRSKRLEPGISFRESIQRIISEKHSEKVRVSRDPLLDIGAMDFLAVCGYVMTTGDLLENDPRLDLIREAKEMLAKQLRGETIADE